MSNSSIVKNSFVRAWIIKNGALPNHAPNYQGRLKFGDWSQSFGDLTRIEEPDETRFDSFNIVDTVRGAADFVTFDLEGRMPMGKSTLLELAKLGCLFDVQAHIGQCADPRLYDNNWKKLLVFEDARATEIGVANFGALTTDERDAANETIQVSAERVYEVLPLTLSDVMPNSITNLVVDVAVYGQRECTECEESNIPGCDTVFVLADNAASASAQAQIIFSDDGFATSGSTIVPATPANPIAIEVVGLYLFVLLEGEADIWYAYIPDVLNGTETWATITGPGPDLQSVHSSSPTIAWVGDSSGNLHKISQLAFTDTWDLSSNAILDVYSLDDQYVLAIDEEEVHYTTNGGLSFTTVDPGVASLHLCCAIVDKNNWMLGTESGDLFYSVDGGVTWSEKVLTVPAGQLSAIAPVTKSVVYLVGMNSGSTAGIVYRSTNGGNSWKVLPDIVGNMPTNMAFGKAAVCRNDPNLLYVGGVNATTGVIIKGIGS